MLKNKKIKAHKAVKRTPPTVKPAASSVSRKITKQSFSRAKSAEDPVSHGTKQKRINIGVVFGGRSGEHEVSLVSARSIIQNIDAEKYNIFQIGITGDGEWLTGPDALEAFKNKKTKSLTSVFMSLDSPSQKLKLHDGGGKLICELDIVFPVLHGPFGEDGTIQGLLEMANVAYVGCSVLGSAIGMDKIVAKKLLDKAGIPTPKYIWFTRDYFDKNKKAVIKSVGRDLGYPCFTKPACLGSSVGISKVKHENNLEKAVNEAAKYDRKIIIEKGINGRELECAVLGNYNPKASVVGEVIVGGEFYDYFDKYVNGKSKTKIPAEIPRNASEEFQMMALKTYRALDCCGMARVDGFLCRDTGKLYINEINTIPGFTSISMFPKLWEYSGMPYKKLIEELIRLGLETHKEKNKNKIAFDLKSDWYKK